MTDKAVDQTNLGDGFICEGQYQQAIDCYRLAIKIDPNYVQAYINLSDSWYKLKKYDEAIQLLNEATIQVPDNAKIHYNLGAALDQQGKTQNAIDCYLLAIKIDPKYVDAYLLLSNSLVKLKKYDEAIQLLNEATIQVPDNAIIHFILGSALEKQNKTLQAIDCYFLAIEINSKYVNAYSNLSISFVKLKKYDEAIQLLNVAMIEVPDNTSFHLIMGYVLDQQNKTQQAIDCYLLAIKIDPKYVDAYLVLSNSLVKLKKYDEAIQLLNEATIQVPDNAIIHFNLGSALEKQNKTLQAIDCYFLAIEIDPKYVNAYSNLSISLVKLRRQDEAIQLLNEAMIQVPNNAKIYYHMAYALNEQDKIQNAIDCCREAIKIDPKYVNAYLYLSLLLNILDQFDEAIKISDEAIILDPSNATAYNNKGYALEKIDQHLEAIECSRMAIKLDSKSPATYNNLGSALMQLQRYDEAIEALDQSIILEPTRPRVHFLKGSALLCISNLTQSMECFEQAIKCDQNYVAGFAMKAQVEQQLGQDEQALISLKRVESLLKDTKNLKGLGKVTIDFIRQSINRIRDLETKLNIKKSQVPQQTNFQTGQGGFEMLKTIGETGLSLEQFVAYMFKEMNDLKNENMILKMDIVNIKTQQLEMRSEVELIKMEQVKMKKTMENSGLYDIEEIKTGWDKYEKESPEMYEYIRIFYWTLLNYFDACRVAGTGLLQQNLNATEDKDVGIGVKIVVKVAELAKQVTKSIPIVGAVIALIIKAVQAVSDYDQTLRYENRMNAMNKIIMDNYFMDDLHRQIAKAALEIASRKVASLSFIQKKEDGFTQKIMKISEQLKEYAKKQFIKIFQSGCKDIKIYETEYGKQALLDVFNLLIYLTVKNEEILQNTEKQPLYLIIAESVMQQNKLDQIDQTIKKETKQEKDEGATGLQNKQQTNKITPMKLQEESPEKSQTLKQKVPESSSSSCCQII